MEKTNMNTQFKSKNHYVPQFYLHNWAVNGEICVYNNLVSHHNVPLFQQKSINGLAYVKHLYTTLSDKQEHDDFEKWFDNEVELPYKNAQDKILSEQRLGYDDFKNIVRFAMAQYLRVPYHYFLRFSSIANGLEGTFERALKQGIKSVEHMIDHNIRPSIQTEEQNFDIPLRLQFVEQQDGAYIAANALLGRNAWLGMIKQLVDSIADKTRSHRWQIIQALPGQSWLTSDNPVTLLNYVSKTQYDYNGVWARKNTNIFMPISPQHLLFTEVGSKQKIENNENFQSLINKCIIENSFLQVYGITPNQSIVEIKPRVEDADEYNRIISMLKSWHAVHTKSEIEFWEE